MAIKFIMDYPNDNECHVEMQKHHKWWMNENGDNRDPMIQILYQLSFPYFGLVYGKSRKKML